MLLDHANMAYPHIISPFHLSVFSTGHVACVASDSLDKAFCPPISSNFKRYQILKLCCRGKHFAIFLSIRFNAAYMIYVAEDQCSMISRSMRDYVDYLGNLSNFNPRLCLLSQTDSVSPF